MDVPSMIAAGHAPVVREPDTSEPEGGGANRRAAIRYPASALSITAVRLSPGDTGALINISSSGLLLESALKYSPGSSVSVHFEGDIATRLIRGRIVRCEVSAIKAGALQYRTALAFDSSLALPVETPSDDVTAPGAAAPGPAPTPPAARAVNRW